MLQRMVAEKLLIKLSRPHVTLDYMYSLKGKRKPLALSNYQHELACGDAYVGLKQTGALEEWVYCPRFEGVEPDRKARLVGIEPDLYFEIDRGTEPLWKIESKVNAYPSGPYQVIFVAPTTTRADAILRVLEDARRGQQFLVTLQEWITDPLGEIFVSPVSITEKRTLVSLQEPEAIT
jgi:hypothetical protein